VARNTESPLKLKVRSPRHLLCIRISETDGIFLKRDQIDGRAGSFRVEDVEVAHPHHERCQS
jgi:hypothetical protein